MAAIIVVVAYWIWWTNFRGILPHTALRAAKVPKGTYELVINHLERNVNSYADELGFRLKLEDVVSEGSIQTIDQIGTHSVDLGLVQANVAARSNTIGAIATIYDEVYLFLTNKPGVTNLYQLAEQSAAENSALRVGCLGKGSQSFEDLHGILDYYGFMRSKVEIVPGNYEETESRLISGKLDAALYVTGLQSETVKRLIRVDGIQLVSFTNRPGFKQSLRGVAEFDLPPGALGANKPGANIATLATQAVLVAHKDLNSETIRRLTAVLIAHKRDFEVDMRFLAIKRPPPELDLPLHAGSAAYYNSSGPFWVTCDPVLRFFLSILTFFVALAGLVVNVRKEFGKRGTSETTSATGTSDKA